MFKDNPKEVDDYIKAMQERISNQGSLIEVNVKNSALSAILQENYEDCNRYGIAFNYIFEYDDLSFLDTSNTCAIFGNALSNAVEACNIILDSSIRKFIDLRVKRHNNMLIITVKNSRDNTLKKIGLSYATSKPKPDQHGLGIISIQLAAKRYCGEVSLDSSKTDFTATIRLNIM